MANVPPNCFMPRPKVGSAVIRLTRYAQPPVQVDDEKKMFRLVRASFNQRRKTLEQMGLHPPVRGEVLTLEQFAQLSNLLVEEA